MSEKFTIEQTADFFGMHIISVYQAIWQGRLKARKVNGRWRVRRSDAEAFLKARRARLGLDTGERDNEREK